jgi:hypothetical protein
LDAEFEEKQFEQHLNFQLADRNNLVYPSGQVGEAFLGFDAAVRTRRRSFWHLFGTFRPGLRIDPLWWPELEEELDAFPKAKFNVFVQSKRPEFLSGPRCKEWHDWQTDYFRYFITEHQQLALTALAEQTAGAAIVVYASPAFHKHQHLWEAINKGDLVSKTNFADAQKLNGHERYTYATAGSSGKGYSHPTDIESPGFESAIAALRERTDGQRWDRFIASVATGMTSAMETLGQNVPIRTAWDEMVARTDTNDRLRRYLYKIDAFLFLVGVSWMVGVDA